MNETDSTPDSNRVENKSWLYRNVTPILGISITAASFMFFVYVLIFDFSNQGEKKDVVIYLLGCVSTILTMVVGYYFGSSKSNTDRRSTDKT